MTWPSPRDGYLARQDEIDEAVRRVLDSGWYVLGGEVEALEDEFARYVGTGEAVGVANGTDALVVCLRALGVGPGARVATVSHTAVATVAAIELVGAQPLLVDVDPATMVMDPASLARVVDRFGAVDAVVPVHLYGHPADVPALRAVAGSAAVVEDCSQAHGARWGGARVGTLGDAAAYSCYPTKNLGALGDAGLLVAPSPVAARAREIRQYGWRERYVSHVPGLNSRLDPLQAAVLRVRLPHLDAEDDRRRSIASRYGDALRELLVTPVEAPGARHVFHQYVVRTPDRDGLRAELESAGVPTQVLYPFAVHQQPAYAGRLLADPAGLPATEQACRELLCLPIHPLLGDDLVDRVIDAVVAWAGA